MSYETMVPAKGKVEVLGAFQFLVHLETVARTRSGSPRKIYEAEVCGPVEAEDERNRFCKDNGWAVLEWSVPPEALTVNLDYLSHNGGEKEPRHVLQGAGRSPRIPSSPLPSEIPETTSETKAVYRPPAVAATPHKSAKRVVRERMSA